MPSAIDNLLIGQAEALGRRGPDRRQQILQPSITAEPPTTIERDAKRRHPPQIGGRAVQDLDAFERQLERLGGDLASVVSSPWPSTEEPT